MPIRIRFLFIIFIGFGALYFTQKYFLFSVMEKAFLDIERQNSVDALDRIDNAFEAEKSFLESKAGDWAMWDESFNFIAGKNPSFIKNNWPDPALALGNLKISYMAFLDKNQKVRASIYSESRDYKNVTEIPPEVIAKLAPYFDLEKPASGLIGTSRGKMVFSVLPIFKGDGTGPANGYCLFGEFIDDYLRQKIHKSTQLETEFLDEIDHAGEDQIQADGSGHMIASRILNSIEDKPLFKVALELERPVNETFIATTKTMNVSLLVVIAMTFFSIVYFLIYHVFKPLQKFVAWQVQVSEESSWKAERYKSKYKPWRVFGHFSEDDLDRLIHSTNSLLDKIDESQKIVEKQTATLVNSEKYRSLGEMSAGIAHEINNPMMIIMMLAGKMRLQLKKVKVDEVLESSFIESIEKIEATIKRTKKIIDGLLRFSRDSSEDAFTPTFAHIPVEDAIELVFENAKRKNVKVKSYIERDLPLSGRPGQLSQVIYNLIGNSIDAIAEKEDPWVYVICRRENSTVIIDIVDSGNGIPVEIREKIFNPFFTTKEVGKGTGLGLSLSHGIILDHGGKIYVNANLKNTCFRIELPLASGANKPQAA